MLHDGGKKPGVSPQIKTQSITCDEFAALLFSPDNGLGEKLSIVMYHFNNCKKCHSNKVFIRQLAAKVIDSRVEAG